MRERRGWGAKGEALFQVLGRRIWISRWCAVMAWGYFWRTMLEKGGVVRAVFLLSLLEMEDAMMQIAAACVYMCVSVW